MGSIHLFAFLVSLVLVIVISAQEDSCRPKDCVWSDECDTSGTRTCRCSYFTCRDYEPGQCGGGCIFDSQCSAWADGDESCICGSLYECISTLEAETPAYKMFVRFMLSARGGYYQRKLAQRSKMITNNEIPVPNKLERS